MTPGPTATEAWLGEGGLADQQGGDREEVLARVGAGRPLGRLATAGGDRRRHRLPLLRARVVRDRRGVERRRRHGADHRLMRDAPRVVGVTLLAALAASQAALVVLNPLLPDVARDLGVSIAAAGQLRTVSGLAAGVAALATGLLAATARAQGAAGGRNRRPRVRVAPERRSSLVRRARGRAGSRGRRDRRLVLGSGRRRGGVDGAGGALARPRARASGTAACVDRRDAARRPDRRGQLATGLARRTDRVGRRFAGAPPGSVGHASREHSRRAAIGIDASGRRTLVGRRAPRVLGVGRRPRLHGRPPRRVVRPLAGRDRARARLRRTRLRAGKPPRSDAGSTTTAGSCSSSSRSPPP